MPLYACERCGFTSAAFRPEAAAAHRHEYPECEGVMRIVFRSEDRYRGEAYALPATPLSVAPTPEAGPAPPAPGAFAIRERMEVDGMLRLTLLGDLDLAVTEQLSGRLEELKAERQPVRLDLSQLVFIDSSGVQALLLALTDARWIGWPVEVAREVSPSVERAAQIVGIGQVLWPQDLGGRQSDPAPLGPPPP